MDQIDIIRSALAERYEIEREIGAGGMAIVYLAEDRKHARRVALKVLRPEVTSLIGHERFLREIAITAQLTHPNILPLHDSGNANGVLYYVMPFVEGETLRHRINREGRIPTEETIRLMSEVADALATAHRRGVVHRDIKPENILIEEGHAVVADFGIARAMKEATGGGQLTQTGFAIGTPAYMSPEQMSGSSDIDATSDVYSLGCVTYEMLTGRPFTDSHTRSSSPDEEDLPKNIEKVVLKSLAEKRSDRFQSADEFKDALAAGPIEPKSRARNFAIGASVGVAVVLILGLFGLIPGMVRPAAAGFFNESDRVVLADFDNDTDQPALGLAIRQAVSADLEQSQYINVVEQTAINSVLQRMRRPDSTPLDLETALEIARREGIPAVVTGSVTPVGSGYQLGVQIVEASTGEVTVRVIENAENSDAVLGTVEKLAHLTRRHLGESLGSVRRSQPLPSVTTQSLEALQMMARGSEFARRGLTEEAIRFGMQAVELDSAFAYAHRALSIWYTNYGQPTRAQRHIDLAHRFNSRLLPRERFLVGATRSTFRGELDSSVHYYSLLLDRYPNDITALNNLGDIRERMGQYEQSLALYQRAIEVGGSSANHVNLASAARTLGMQRLADSVYLAMLDKFPNTWGTWNAQIQNAFYAGRHTRVEQIAVDMLNHEFPFPRVFGAYMMSSLSAMRGHIQQAIVLADSSATMAEGVSTSFLYLPLWTAQYTALAGDAPELVIPLLDNAPRPQNLGSAPSFEYGTLGLLANGYALAGETSAAEHLLTRMDSLMESLDVRPSGIGAEVRAMLALQAGLPEQSLAHLREAQALEFGRVSHTARFTLAQTYATLERWQQAAAHYDSLASTYGLNYQDVWTYGPLFPVALERSAQSYLMLGDTATAAERLGAFVDLWDNADAALQPLVTDARSRLARIVGEPAGR